MLIFIYIFGFEFALMNTCLTIYEKGKQIKLYPFSKKIHIFADDLELSFDSAKQSFIKRQISSRELLPMSEGEKSFYKKLLLKYLLSTKSWEPPVFAA